MHFCRRIKTPPPKKSLHDTKLSDGEAPVMLELWGMRRTYSLPLLPGPHWPGVVAPDRVLSIGQIELLIILTVCKQITDVLIELLVLNGNAWKHWAVCKEMINSKYNYSYWIEIGARGVMVIVVESGHGDMSSNPGRDWLHFT